MIATPPTDFHPRDGEAFGLLAELQRYAGWLDKDHASVAVRAGLRDLAEAMQSGGDVLGCRQRLNKDLQRLQSGGVRTMLRRSFQALQAALEANAIREQIRL